jgi:hypothetical protein
MMTSVFVATKAVHGLPAGSPTKISFSSQEWCGHVYEQAIFNEDAVQRTLHSYFEVEADKRDELPHPQGGIAEDALWLWARGLAGPSLEPGESLTLPLYRSLEYRRMKHVPAAWSSVELTRTGETQTIDTPIGSMQTERYTAEVTPDEGTLEGPFAREAQRRTWTYDVETEFPHRVVRWSRQDGLEAKLIGVKRMPYWNLNAKEHENLLKQMGLKPRGERMP